MSVPGPPSRPQRLSRAVQAFVRTEASGGVVLLVAALAALVWANSPWHGSYERLWSTELGFSLGGLGITEDLRHWVNDGLMAVFFLVVGLEVKRELVTGELRDRRSAALPIVAAVGGMVVPALVYAAFNAGRAGSDGWGIPMATDIAFALGVLAVVGRSAHPSLKVFLLTLAVADDIGAILVIAVFYAETVRAWWLLAALALAGTMVVAHRSGVRSLGPYVLLGLGVWWTVFESGVHATIAGVALGLLAPARPSGRDGWRWRRSRDERRPVARGKRVMVERLEQALHPWTSFAVVPIFALANSGVRLGDLELGAEGAAAVAVGTAGGLVVGKFVGILAASWLAVRTRVGRMPVGLTWPQLAGGAACAGIGFTVSLFIAGLAFDEAVLTDAAKAGVLGGSGVAAGAAALILAGSSRRATRAGN